MKKSVLLQKVFLVVTTALILTVVSTSAIYAVISRSMFASIKAGEMLPKARLLSSLLAQTTDDVRRKQTDTLLGYMQENESLLGGYLAIFDADGGLLAASKAINTEDFQAMDGFVRRVLAGEEISAYSGQFLSHIQMVGVGTPIIVGREIRGAVLLFVPLYEALAAASGLTSALIMSMLIVMPFVVMLVYVVIGRIIRPLRQMRDAALAMASGNFDIEADVEQRGEVGQLASSLNYLSKELSHNLSELTIERNRFKQTVDGLREGLVSVNAMGRITYYNPAISDMFPHKDWNGNRQALIDDKDLWDDFDHVVSNSLSAVRDLSVNNRIIRVTIAPIQNEEGRTVGAVGLFTDITESERLEQTRRDYVANVSHELRTPLTAMRGLLEPLCDGMVRTDEARQRYYQILLRETLRLSRLIDDLMELSRLQSGKLSLVKQKVDLRMIIEDLADKYTSTAEDKDQTFTLLTPPEEFPAVLANPDRVEQILVILLDNAMKYTPEGGSISLSARREGDKVILSVADSGIGISQEDLPYVFDRFYKADKSRTGATGSGLGLSIAKEILQQMGEDIWVTSEKGKGSTFSLTLTVMEQSSLTPVSRISV